MMKHSFQSHTLRSKAEGESEESISSEEEEDELNREKMMLRKEKVRAELKAGIARDIWKQQTSEEVKRDWDQGSLLLLKLVGCLLFKYSNFQQIYKKKTQPIL